MMIVESRSMDVYRNLATEEYLMEHADRLPVLFLWRSDSAVVVGKNQNPWRECRLDRMRNDGIPLARRISGGGTVYHDVGNLNYCVITDRQEYRDRQAYEMVLQALKTLGIRAEKEGKSNLCVDGLKFSGNAFCFRKGRALHHGTLLLHTDLEKLGLYIGSMFGGIETRAVQSIPAAVANLDLGIAEVCAALESSFQALYDGGKVVPRSDGNFDRATMQRLVERQESDDWKYGATPKFLLEHGGLRIEVAKGKIVFAEGEGAARLEGRLFKDVAFSLADGLTR